MRQKLGFEPKYLMRRPPWVENGGGGWGGGGGIHPNLAGLGWRRHWRRRNKRARGQVGEAVRQAGSIVVVACDVDECRGPGPRSTAVHQVGGFPHVRRIVQRGMRRAGRHDAEGVNQVVQRRDGTRFRVGDRVSVSAGMMERL